MELARSLDDLTERFRGGAVTIGNFDGVHRGHARIVERLLDKARKVGGPAVVFTFDPHPVRILRPELEPPPLTWTDRKAELLADLGVDSMLAYPTDKSLLALSAEEFFQQIVLQRLEARAMIEGPNFCFGRDRAGDIDLLSRYCRETDIELEIADPLLLGDAYVSSSRVRQAIRAGDIAAASDLLTRPYRIRGMVTHGAGRGANIGFPTANVHAIDTLIPADGVYAGRAMTESGSWPAAINIGTSPTFGEQIHKVEVHLIGFTGSLYGQPLEVDFLKRLRDIQPFKSSEALQGQLQRDVEAARKITEKTASREC